MFEFAVAVDLNKCLEQIKLSILQQMFALIP